MEATDDTARLAASVAEVQHRLAVQEAVHRYCWAYDRRDADALADLITDDIVIRSGEEFTGAPAALAFWRHTWTRTEASRHHVTNMVISLDGVDGAVAESYFTSVVVMAGQSKLVFGSYRDRLVFDGSAWRFREKDHEVHSYGPFADGLRLPGDEVEWRR